MDNLLNDPEEQEGSENSDDDLLGDLDSFFEEQYLTGEIKALQALHHVLPLHLHQASAITLSKIKSKGRCISLSLNIINIDVSTC